MTNPSDVIDLTNSSFTLANHCGISNLVIDLDTDDSICVDANCSNDSVIILPVENETHENNSKHSLRRTAVKVAKKKKIHQQEPCYKRKSNEPSTTTIENKDKFGGCPICWDDLGKNPLASTKCGHVFCFKCIQEYLKFEKRCPTCRQLLKGSAAYHPLYLSTE